MAAPAEPRPTWGPTAHSGSSRPATSTARKARPCGPMRACSPGARASRLPRPSCCHLPRRTSSTWMSPSHAGSAIDHGLTGSPMATPSRHECFFATRAGSSTTSTASHSGKPCRNEWTRSAPRPPSSPRRSSSSRSTRIRSFPPGWATTIPTRTTSSRGSSSKR